MSSNKHNLTAKNWSVAVMFAIIILSVAFLFDTNSKQEDTKYEEMYKTAIIETNLGNIKLLLLSDKAPETVRNFIKLSLSGFYNGTKIHRITRDFIQGGDPLSKLNDSELYGKGGPGYTIIDEINDEEFVLGAVAMANTGEPNTAGSQFFIITSAQAPWLKGKHTIFAKIVTGKDIAVKISKVKVYTSNDVPVEPVIVKRIEIRP